MAWVLKLFISLWNWKILCWSIFLFHHCSHEQRIDLAGGPMWFIHYSYSDPSQQLTFSCAVALGHTGPLAFCLRSPCSHTTVDVHWISCQSYNKIELFLSTKCISEDISLQELNDASAFRGKLHTGNINPLYLIQGHLFKWKIQFSSVLMSVDVSDDADGECKWICSSWY